MDEGMDLAHVLGRFLKARDWSFERLADEAGVPRNTVYRWLRGDVKKPQTWYHLASVANTLELSRAETNLLLQSAHHRPVEELLDRVKTDDERQLLARWAVDIPSNLPGTMTSIIGREEEVRKALTLLSSARLLTLTGPGGAGKSRLALEVAEAALERFPDGVLFVALADIRDPRLVVPEIARVLGLPESPSQQPMQQLRAHLRRLHMLLVLDNFEQVVDAARHVGELLRATPPLKVIVTSRTRLFLSGELELPVPPLALPKIDSSFEQQRASPAVALFTERAQAADPRFVLTHENAPLVAEVCARLDGLPLAIELAAARVRRFPLRALLDRFASRLELASSAPVDVDPRQQTLRNAISWSYDLLSDDERKLFRRVSVFAGGFSDAAAARVATLGGDGSFDAEAVLDALRDDNLLQRTVGVVDERRFTMLETIREYALERLEESGEMDAARRAHADYYIELADEAEPRYDGPQQTYWLNRLDQEHLNFRAALAWLHEQGAVVEGLRLSTALMTLWQLRDHHVQGGAWLEAFLTAAHDVPPRLHAKALLWHGLLLMRFVRDVPAAVPLFERALVLYRECGYLSGAAEALQALGDAARYIGDTAAARRRYEESAAAAQQGGDSYLTARAYFALAGSFDRDLPAALDAAEHYWSLTLEYAERAGNRATIALALNGVGEMARYRRDYARAEEYYLRALDAVKGLDSGWRAAMPLHNLAYIAYHQRQYERAHDLFVESLLLHKTRDYRKGIAECVAGLATVATSQGQLERAAYVAGAAECLLEALGEQLDSLDRAEFEQSLSTLREQLRRERFDVLRAEGRAMPLEQALEYAASTATAPL